MLPKKIVSTQTKETSTWSRAKPAAESMFGKIDVKRVNKQMETNPLSCTEKPEAELEHIFGKFDVKNIKKQMKNRTSSTGEPVADTRPRTLNWIEFKEYSTHQSKRKTMLEDH